MLPKTDHDFLWEGWCLFWEDDGQPLSVSLSKDKEECLSKAYDTISRIRPNLPGPIEFDGNDFRLKDKCGLTMKVIRMVEHAPS